MVITKSELIAALQDEVRILLHLASKVDPAKLDYRPTEKQRSTIELLRYLSMMGPVLVDAAKTGTFNEALWNENETAANARTFDETVAAIAAQSDAYATVLADIADADFAAEIAPFRQPTTRGGFLVRWVLGGCAAYRTQLFCYLKSCGREELSTWDLWQGMDAPPKA
jgi:hypothetical protein